MLACWNLRTTDGGTEVRYDNLRDAKGMTCGVTRASALALLDFMVREGGGGSEVVFYDGRYCAHLMPALTERLSHALTGTDELQG